MALAKGEAQVGTNRASSRAVAAALGLNEADKSGAVPVNRRYLAEALGIAGERDAAMTVDGVVAACNARLLDDVVAAVQVDGNDDNILSWSLPDGWLPPVSWKVQWRDSPTDAWTDLLTTTLTGWTDRQRQGRAQTGEYGILGSTPWGDLRRAVVESTRTRANPSITNKIASINEGATHSYTTSEPEGFQVQEVSWRTTHGSISATGRLRAPYVASDTTVTVSLLYYGVVVDTDAVTVNNTLDAQITNAPLTVPSGGTFQFTWSASTAVAFSTTQGTIDEDGEWSIPAVTRTTHARVTLLQGGATAQVVDIQIVVEDLTPEITNKITSLRAGERHVYTISNRQLSDSVYLRVKSGPGRILGAATLEATGTAAGTIVVELVEDGGVVDTDSVAVTPPVAGTISNKISTIAEGASRTFTSAGITPSGGTVTWSAASGAITNAGAYTAPQVGSGGGSDTVSLLVNGTVVDTDTFDVTNVVAPPLSVDAGSGYRFSRTGAARYAATTAASASGGDGSYSYSWTSARWPYSATTQSVTWVVAGAAHAGSASVTVTDGAGRTARDSASIAAFGPALSVDAGSGYRFAPSAPFNGQPRWSATTTATASGGARTGYSYSWTSARWPYSATTQSVTWVVAGAADAGSASVTVTDADGTQASDSTSIAAAQ